MKIQTQLNHRAGFWRRPTDLFLPLAAILLLVAVTTPLHADGVMAQPGEAAHASQLNYLQSGKPDAATLLPRPPLPDSAEELADLDEVRAVYRAASAADKTAAYSEHKFTVFNFATVVGPYFAKANLPRTAAFFKKIQRDAETVTDLGKDYFQRPRPYVIDPSLANGKLEHSFSYPSGHSTESMVLALVLADLIPSEHDAIIAHARQMGWHRVQIARHYATDIYAGRVLAQAIVKQFQKNDDFKKEFNEAKAEIEAACKTSEKP